MWLYYYIILKLPEYWISVGKHCTRWHPTQGFLCRAYQQAHSYQWLPNPHEQHLQKEANDRSTQIKCLALKSSWSFIFALTYRICLSIKGHTSKQSEAVYVWRICEYFLPHQGSLPILWKWFWLPLQFHRPAVLRLLVTTQVRLGREHCRPITVMSNHDRGLSGW